MKLYITLLLCVSSALSSTSALKDQQVPNGEEDEERHATALRKGSRSARAHGAIVRLDNNNRLKREDWPRWKKPSFKINLKSSDGKPCVSRFLCKSNCCYKAVCQSRCPPNLPNNGACWYDRDCSSKRCDSMYKCQAKAKVGEFCQWGLDDECENGLSCSVKNKCYHLPRHENEPCGNADCGDGLYCGDYKCQKRAGEGEECEVTRNCSWGSCFKPCEDGLDCYKPDGNLLGVCVK